MTISPFNGFFFFWSSISYISVILIFLSSYEDFKVLSERSCTCICVLGVSFLSLSTIFLLDFGPLPTVVFYFFFHFMIQLYLSVYFIPISAEISHSCFYLVKKSWINNLKKIHETPDVILTALVGISHHHLVIHT